MNLMDAIYTRRSVRKYTEAKVDRDLIKKLLAAAVQAPSASNTQPWAFAVIQDTATLHQLSTKAKEMLLSVMDENPALAKYRGMLSNKDFNIFYNAGTLLIIYAKPAGLHAQGDCCLAAQNVMLAAHDMGLGTCWIGFAVALLNNEDIKKELGVSAEYTAVAPLIVGYPESDLAQIIKNDPDVLFWR